MTSRERVLAALELPGAGPRAPGPGRLDHERHHGPPPGPAAAAPGPGGPPGARVRGVPDARRGGAGRGGAPGHRRAAGGAARAVLRAAAGGLEALAAVGRHARCWSRGSSTWRSPRTGDWLLHTAGDPAQARGGPHAAGRLLLRHARPDRRATTTTPRRRWARCAGSTAWRPRSWSSSPPAPSTCGAPRTRRCSWAAGTASGFPGWAASRTSWC